MLIQIYVKKFFKWRGFHNDPVLSSTLNKEIKNYFLNKKSKLIKNKINNTNGSLWKAVSLAKNKSTNDIPTNLTYRDTDIAKENCAEVFAGFFHDKIEKFKSDISIKENVHNGYNKLIVADRFFYERIRYS